ncbi:hypothetical protein MLD38_010203 [Melastoma candidum]|uniref:Uncharacterized protein n=1 Tax=Melastoma candidum TaxID=119954 RepID=A0ACB9QYM9_9MYRT|nr:hypothetical protein MLD38_010203 [Melastoma candidum]
MDPSKFSALSLDDSEHDIHYAMNLVTSSVLPMILGSAIDLGILDILDAHGPGAKLSPYQIASELKAGHPEAPSMIDHMLCLLASHSILTCSVEADATGSGCHRFYGLAPVARYFTKNSGRGSLGSWMLMVQHKVVLNSWFNLKEAVMDGGFPFEMTHGATANKYFAEHPPLFDDFRSSAKDFNKLIMVRILDTYSGFEGINLLIDVGGGDGSVLNTILSKYPSMRGINYDLPPVIENCPSYERIEHIPGSMLSGVPKGDAILIKWVLHSWDDEHFLKVLNNCYTALPSEGKVIVIDMVIPESPEPSPLTQNIFQFYLHVKTMNPRRIERTAREFENLAKGAGFSGICIPTCAYNFSVIEFLKNK